MASSAAAESLFSRVVGRGVYEVPFAAKLTGVSGQAIRRWMRGYTFKSSEVKRRSEPLWEHDLPVVDDVLTLSFLDLMEVRFVAWFRKEGLSWRVIRECASYARESLDSGHPFTTKRFKTDGRTIFFDYLEENGQERLLDLLRRQYAAKPIVAKSLYRGIEFEDDVMARWKPSKGVVLDPKRRFGAPFARDSGVPTYTLFNTWQVEDEDEKRVAWIFDVPVVDVRNAVRFEQRFLH